MMSHCYAVGMTGATTLQLRGGLSLCPICTRSSSKSFRLPE